MSNVSEEHQEHAQHHNHDHEQDQELANETTSGATDDLEDEDSPLNILNDYMDESDEDTDSYEEETEGDSRQKAPSTTTDCSGSDDGKSKINKNTQGNETKVKFSDDVEANVHPERTQLEKMSLIRRRRLVLDFWDFTSPGFLSLGFWIFKLN